MQMINSVLDFLSNNAGVISSVLGFAVMVISKAASTEKANGVIAGIQKSVDALAEVVQVIGKALAFASKILADLIKSDGTLGKK